MSSATRVIETTGTGREPAGTVMDALRRIVRALRAADRDSEAALGLPTAQLFVLREVEKAGMLTVSELARRTATAQSSVSEVLKRLLGRELVTRTQSVVDRRRAEIALSARGRELLARAPETVQERLLGAFRRLPRAQQREAADAMCAWVAEAGLADVTPTMFFEPPADG
jgi:DNA-binding MarR family transcriptional regulator